MNNRTAIITLISAATLFVAGIFVGRYTISKDTTTHIVGKTIRDSISYDRLVPKYITTPVLMSYLELDTLYIPIYTTNPKDTLGSLKMVLVDWNLKRSYNDVLFNDSTRGKFEYKATVQFNKIRSFVYEYTPIQTIVTKNKIRILQPFISIEYSNLNTVGVGGGLFYHNLGLEMMYNRNYIDNNKGISLGLKYKF